MINVLIADRNVKDLFYLENVLYELSEGEIQIETCKDEDPLQTKLNENLDVLLLRFNFFENDSYSMNAFIKEILKKHPQLHIIVSDNQFNSTKYFNLYASGVFACINLNKIDFKKDLADAIKEIKKKSIFSKCESSLVRN